MSWNYRVIKHNSSDETIYAIHEVYYHDNTDNFPKSCTTDPVAFVGNDVEELRVSLIRALSATLKPVLDMEMFDSMAQDVNEVVDKSMGLLGIGEDDDV